MENLVKEDLSVVSLNEEVLIPKMLTEYWPELVFVRGGDSGVEYNVKPWYGFMYLDIARIPIGNRAHGPAILRLSEGSIFVIDQNDAWNDWLPKRKNYVKKVIEISISDPKFYKYKPIINKRIKEWLKYAAKVLRS